MDTREAGCLRKVDVRCSTRCHSSSLIRLQQSRARGPWTFVSHSIAVWSLAKKVAVHLLTNGTCRACLISNVDEAWRIEQPVWSETTVTTAVLRWRAVDMDASASCEEKSRRDRRFNYRRQADVPAAVDGAWHHCAPVPKSRVRRTRARVEQKPTRTCFFFFKKKKRTHKGTGRSLYPHASSSHMMVQGLRHTG